ncbi:MAG: PhoH family protein [Alkalispirochaeta sp.]
MEIQREAHMPEKTFIIDTNVLIHRPDAILSFKGCVVVLPMWVLEELDRLKTFSDERGRNARRAIRFLDTAGQKGNLAEGVRIDNGTTLKVVASQPKKIPNDFFEDKADNKIILTAWQIQQEGGQVFFVSKDINARVKATALGIKAVDYEKQKVDITKLYTGFSSIDVRPEAYAQLRDSGSLEWPEDLPPNHFLLLRDRDHEDEIIGRFVQERAALEFVDHKLPAVAGIRPLNDEQRIALDLLCNPEIELVSLVGKAGTGKTLLALAAGLKQTLEDKTYKRVLVSRPVIPMGKDIGYLPGAKDEKLSHWMRPLFDNLEFILSVYHKQNVKTPDQLIANNTIELEALSYIRGRSLPSQFIIIDEAQNLSPHEVKTIVSRAGADAKVVLTGDPFQIDSPYLDANSNGLTYLVEAFKGQSIFGHVLMTRSERSHLAELAAELL